VKPVFRAHETWAAIWAQAQSLFANNTQHPYGVCHDLMTVISVRSPYDSMTNYLGQVSSLLQNYNELLPPIDTTS